MKLQKLVFFSQAWYLALFDQPLFNEDFQAWKYGPVIPELHKRFKEFRQGKAISVAVECPVLSPEPEKLLNCVSETFMHKNSFALSHLTHEFDGPWYKTREGLSPDAPSDRVINKDLIEMYYKDLLVDKPLDDIDNDVMLVKFLDFLVKDLEKNPDKLVSYTKDILKEDKKLIRGVVFD